jgi:hypothetical protein
MMPVRKQIQSNKRNVGLYYPFKTDLSVGKLLLVPRQQNNSWVRDQRDRIFHNSIYKFSSYLTGNILRLLYKAQPVNAVWGNSRCLL